MKYKARKLLSLFLAFVLVCGTIPAAFAAETYTPGANATWTGGEIENCKHETYTQSVTKQPTCKETGSVTFTCTCEEEATTPEGGDQTEGQTKEKVVCGATCTQEISKLTTHTEGTEYISDSTNHYKKCSVCGEKVGNGAAHSGTWTVASNKHVQKCSTCQYVMAEHTANVTTWTKTSTTHSGTCSQCSQTVNGDHEWTYSNITETKHTQTCKVCGYSETVNHTAGKTCVCGYDPTEITVSITGDDNLTGKTYDYNDDIKLTVDVSVKRGGVEMAAKEYDIVYEWSGDLYDDPDDYDGPVAWLDTSLAEADAYCTVTVYIGKEKVDSKKLSWHGEVDSEINVEATIYSTNPGYALGDPDDEGGDSIVDQIVDAIDKLNGKNDDYTLDYVKFSEVKGDKGDLDASTRAKYYYDDEDEDDDLSTVTFTPDSEEEGKVSFTFTAYCSEKRSERTYSGTITFDVKEGEKGIGILYTAEKGENVELDPDDLEDFWNEKYSKGELKYVVFDSVSGGTLYDNYDGGKKNWTDVEEDETKCYLEPSKRETGLDDLTFVPASSKKTTTATIRFTATGTTGKSSSRTADMTGTITILYLDGQVRDIVCTSRNSDGSVTMDPADFLDVYRDVMSTNKSTTLSIQFLKVPTYGTLYYKYDTDRNGKLSKSTVELKTSNIASYSFSTGKTGKRLDDVTYVPGRSALNDSVTYACYVGGTLKYIGTVTFGLEKVELKCTASAAGVTFKSSDFFTGNLLTCQYITFGVPSSGALYQNGSTRVSTYDKFGYTASATQGISAISTVSYMPVAGYNGVVEIPFTAVTYSGGSISGTMRVTVVSKTFSDVPTTHWSYPYISRLAAEGVVSGITATTFGPNNKVEYGAALKMILLATGYPKQSENTSGNWAANYLTLAYNSGIVSSKNVDLTKAITRTEMAEIAAKALKLSSASRVNAGITGPTDTTNGYVYALYNAKIVGGDTSTGKNLYRGDSSLTREEMAKIVCNVSDYYKNK